MVVASLVFCLLCPAQSMALQTPLLLLLLLLFLLLQEVSEEGCRWWLLGRTPPHVGSIQGKSQCLVHCCSCLHQTLFWPTSSPRPRTTLCLSRWPFSTERRPQGLLQSHQWRETSPAPEPSPRTQQLPLYLGPSGHRLRLAEPLLPSCCCSSTAAWADKVRTI